MLKSEAEFLAQLKELGVNKMLEYSIKRINQIRLGRVLPELSPIERGAKANELRYFIHKYLNIKLK